MTKSAITRIHPADADSSAPENACCMSESDAQEQAAAWSLDCLPDAKEDPLLKSIEIDCGCVSNRIREALTCRRLQVEDVSCAGDQPDFPKRVKNRKACEVPEITEVCEEVQEDDLEDFLKRRKKKSTVKEECPKRPSILDKCLCAPVCYPDVEQFDEYLELLVHQYLGRYTFSMKQTRASWQTCLGDGPEVASPSGKVCEKKPAPVVESMLKTEDLTPEGTNALSPWSPAYDLCDKPPRPQYRVWFREAFSWIVDSATTSWEERRTQGRFVAVPWVSGPVGADICEMAPSRAALPQECTEKKEEPKVCKSKSFICETKGRRQKPENIKDEDCQEFPFKSISSGALHRKGMDHFKAEPDYEPGFPSFHRVPSLILEDPCSEKHKLSLAAVEGAKAVPQRSMRGHHPRSTKHPSEDLLCDPANLYDHYKHSPAAKAAIAKGQRIKPKSKKTWFEWFEDLMFGEEDSDDLCDYEEEECEEECMEQPDEEPCDEIDELIKARRCKDPCSGPVPECEDPEPLQGPPCEDPNEALAATIKNEPQQENPSPVQPIDPLDEIFGGNKCEPTFPFSSVCKSSSGHKLTYKWSRTTLDKTKKQEEKKEECQMNP